MARCVEYAPLIKPITERVLSERYNSTHGLMINTRCMLFTGLGVRIGKNVHEVSSTGSRQQAEVALETLYGPTKCGE